jgi:hypothetical protein
VRGAPHRAHESGVEPSDDVGRAAGDIDVDIDIDLDIDLDIDVDIDLDIDAELDSAERDS